MVITFIYKRTHKGDPDEDGFFGVEDCMGRIRGCDFDAVIGIGGIGRQARSQTIDRRVNWIGIGPRRSSLPGKRGPIVTFERFALFEDKGQRLHLKAPTLARRMYSRRSPRFVFSHKLTTTEQKEIAKLLELARTKLSSRRIQRRHLRATGDRSPKCGYHSRKTPTCPPCSRLSDRA